MEKYWIPKNLITWRPMWLWEENWQVTNEKWNQREWFWIEIITIPVKSVDCWSLHSSRMESCFQDNDNDNYNARTHARAHALVHAHICLRRIDRIFSGQVESPYGLSLLICYFWKIQFIWIVEMVPFFTKIVNFCLQNLLFASHQISGFYLNLKTLKNSNYTNMSKQNSTPKVINEWLLEKSFHFIFSFLFHSIHRNG